FVVQSLFRSTGFLIALWTTGLKKKVNDMLAAYLLGHGHHYFSNRFSGSLLSKLGSVIGGIEGFIPDLMWTHLPAVVSFSVTTIFIWRADTLSGVLFVGQIVTLIVTNRLLAKKKRKLS